ncbi:flagellar protein FlaG [Candidatus Enterovibrio altilux]|uniref:Flagellin protein FlaG n=1 Tax=Candidatus Enterovibrio altilux TaxID=1927128 RepID=A0A291B892_9GAMM|nr:flagellar protein FlaG [Candidatus Enterovibrio luxaltus]ATF09212.1 Flagellin protein FlaG [Candidatus Enterovibrio luxaltus]
MDITSVSLTSLSHVSPQSGSQMDNSKKPMGETQLKTTHQHPSIANVEKFPKRPVGQVYQFKDLREIQQEQLETLVARLDEFVSTFNKGLSFRLDEDSGKSVVIVYEMSSGDIIRQIPEKEMLELAQQLSLHARGLVEVKV